MRGKGGKKEGERVGEGKRSNERRRGRGGEEEGERE